MMENTSHEVLPTGFYFKDCVRQIFAWLPIVPNIIAIILGLGLLCLMQQKILFPASGDFPLVLKYLIKLLIAWNIIRSGRHSLLLVVLTLGLATLPLLGDAFALLRLTAEWKATFQQLFTISILGNALAIFYIGKS